MLDVWQKPTQYCNYLSIKNKLKNKTNKKYDEFYIKFLTSAVQSEGLNIQTDNSQTICKDRTLIWNLQHLAQEASLLTVSKSDFTKSECSLVTGPGS